MWEEILLPEPSLTNQTMSCRGVVQQVGLVKHIVLISSSELSMMLQVGTTAPPIWTRAFSPEDAECMVKVLMWAEGHELILPTPPDESRLSYRMSFLVPRKQGATRWVVLQRCTRWNEETGHTINKELFRCISESIGRQQQIMIVVSNKWMYHDRDGDLRKSAAIWRSKNPEHPLTLEEQRAYSQSSDAAAAEKAAACPVLVASSCTTEPTSDPFEKSDKDPHIKYDTDLGWDDDQEKHAINECQERGTRARSAAVEEAKADAGET
jgi:hypothetical protein